MRCCQTIPAIIQGIAISYVNSMGEFSDPEEGKALQNFMICVEMAIAGVALLFAFPHAEYKIGGSTSGWRLSAFLHAISVRDVLHDTIHVVRRPQATGKQPLQHWQLGR